MKTFISSARWPQKDSNIFENVIECTYTYCIRLFYRSLMGKMSSLYFLYGVAHGCLSRTKMISWKSSLDTAYYFKVFPQTIGSLSWRLDKKKKNYWEIRKSTW